MQANPNSSVLIEQVVYLASKARQATGQDPIFDIPKGSSGASVCPIARALNLSCSVTGSGITFKNNDHASQVAHACGLPPTNGSYVVSVPLGHPFRVFVSKFDAGTDRNMTALELEEREMSNEIRVLHSRRIKQLGSLFEEAGAVVKEGADVGGDVRVAWDENNEDECREVGKLFDGLKSKGFSAIKVGDDGKLKDGQKIDKFDKGVGRMVMLPPLQGGS